jgi:hypothetical protein
MPIHNARKARLTRNLPKPGASVSADTVRAGATIDVELVERDGRDWYRAYLPNTFGGFTTTQIEQGAFEWLPNQKTLIAENE